MPVQAITVYCSSSSALAPHFYAAGAELGGAIAANNWKLIYGGNSVGLMKTVADAVRAAGGKVIGVTPKIFVDKGIGDHDCHELIVTDCMRDRKHQLEQRGDAFVALPGGLGTFEEIFEIIVGRQLAFHNKPVVLLNIAGYWDPMLGMIDSAIEQKFIKPRARELFFVAQDVPQAIGYLRSYTPTAPDGDKWMSGIPSAIE
jgi:uncharacterized protein (TIGR00730 family)